MVIYSIVSIAKINACRQPLKMSKYTESTAGIPMRKSGNDASAPGNRPSTMLDSPPSPAATSTEITEPESTFP